MRHPEEHQADGEGGGGRQRPAPWGVGEDLQISGRASEHLHVQEGQRLGWGRKSLGKVGQRA